MVYIIRLRDIHLQSAAPPWYAAGARACMLVCSSRGEPGCEWNQKSFLSLHDVSPGLSQRQVELRMVVLLSTL